jgi:hypothetical protein
LCERGCHQIDINSQCDSVLAKITQTRPSTRRMMKLPVDQIFPQSDKATASHIMNPILESHPLPNCVSCIQ